MGAGFATTQWSQVLAARDATGTESQKALASLCEAYWYPLYTFVRSQGHDPEESKDLTQAYFAYLLDRNILEDVDPSAGRFRSFLLVTLKHYVSKERRKQSTLKRGGGTRTISLDTGEAEARYGQEPADGLRQRFGQLIREEIDETVASPDDIDDEVRHLLAVVGPWESSPE